jgi:hypothetical protein
VAGTLKHPTNPLVTRAWLALVPGITADMTGTTLPRISGSSLPAWVSTGFLTVQTVGGSPSIDTLQASPVVSVKCWAVNATQPGTGAEVALSQRVPWGRSEELAEAVRHAADALRRDPTKKLVTLPVAGYEQAVVDSAELVSEIRPLQDPTGYACHQFDLHISWIPVVT